MSGFKDDVISILRHNSILQKESVGFVMTETSTLAEELFQELKERKFLVTNKRTKLVLQYDYVVIPSGYNWENFLYAFSVLSTGGVIVLEANEKVWSDKYVSLFGGFTGTKVRYEDRIYIVIHGGVDYAD